MEEEMGPVHSKLLQGKNSKGMSKNEASKGHTCTALGLRDELLWV